MEAINILMAKYFFADTLLINGSKIEVLSAKAKQTKDRD
ncbi:hypothetical protein CASFOL_028957 [Castilleja foliolosa]|uniref:Uncharacterized protein n=1 Tax=Castilleja foliolosa TaxID=1961234 RepID=A0ABD3CE60_9LAMI